MTEWTRHNATWAKLNPYQRAAVMSLMEADGANPQSARNALAAMINRAAKSGADIGEHVSGRIYQPTIEPAQERRLSKLINTPAFSDLTSWAERRSRGEEADPVNGATHFLAPEKTMLSLEASNPSKYKNWGPRGANWTKYGEDPARPNEYKGVILRDSSHAFLAPEGAFSVASKDTIPAAGQPAPTTSIPPVLVSNAGRESFPAMPAVADASPVTLPVPQAPSPDVSVGGFQWKVPGLKDVGKGIGGFAQAGLGGGQDNRAAEQLTKIGMETNAANLNDEERRQLAALELVRSRRQRAAFA